MLREGEFQKAPWWPERLGVRTHGPLTPQHLTGCDPQSPDQITTFLILPPQRSLVGPQAAPIHCRWGMGFPQEQLPSLEMLAMGGCPLHWVREKEAPQ